MTAKCIVRPIRTVVQIAHDLELATDIFTNGIGFEIVGETVAKTEDVGELWGIRDAGFRVRRLARAGTEFGAVDLVESPRAASPMRDPKRAYDRGLFSLNFRTGDLDGAMVRLAALGATAISDPVGYDVGKPMREVLMDIGDGTRITLIQVGDTDVSAPLFGEPVATYGLIVPSVQSSLGFYRDALGLEVAIAFSHTGPPFDTALGIEGDLAMEFATLTAGGEWMAKLELLELNVSGTAPENRSELADFEHCGYAFLTWLTNEIGATRKICVAAGADVIVEPKRFTRPFHEGSRAMIIRAPGGEYLEFIETQ